MQTFWNTLRFEILTGHSCRFDRSWADEGRTASANDFNRLYLMNEGEAVVRGAGEVTRVVAGRLCLFPGGPEERTYRCVTSSMHLTCSHFRIETIAGISLFAHCRPPAPVVPGFDPAPVFRGLIDAQFCRTPAETLTAVQSLMTLIQPFLPATWEELLPPRGTVERLRPALDLIRFNLDRSVSLAEMATAVHLHPTYFSNLFREVFGQSPVQYHLEQRLRRARSLLLNSDRGVAEIGQACGFDEPLYFSRIFRKKVGVCPRAFRACQGILGP